MNKTMSALLLTFIGVGLLAVGLITIKTMEETQGLLGALPYIGVGLGSVLFGHGIGEVILRSAMKKSPAAAKQLEIDRNDERNLTIENRAKAKAYDMMIFVFGALIISFAVMGIDLAVLLLLIFAYLVILVSNSYYRIKYGKEM